MRNENDKVYMEAELVCDVSWAYPSTSSAYASSATASRLKPDIVPKKSAAKLRTDSLQSVFSSHTICSYHAAAQYCTPHSHGADTLHLHILLRLRE